jgi:hypothetical protein
LEIDRFKNPCDFYRPVFHHVGGFGELPTVILLAILLKYG